VVVEVPLATIEFGFRPTVMVDGGPAVWSRVAGSVVVRFEVLSVAVIDAVPTVVELVMVALYVPSPLSVVPPTVSPRPLDENVTDSPVTTAPVVSVTVTVAVLVEVPSAMMLVGSSDTLLIAVAGPAAWAGRAESDNVIPTAANKQSHRPARL